MHNSSPISCMSLQLTATHYLAFAIDDATHFSQINSRKLIINSVSPFRLLTFRPISDNSRFLKFASCALLDLGILKMNLLKFVSCALHDWPFYKSCVRCTIGHSTKVEPRVSKFMLLRTYVHELIRRPSVA